MAGEGWWMGFKFIDQPGQSSEVEHNPKMSISFSGRREMLDGFESIDQPGRSTEIEHNPKTSIFIILAGEGWQMGFKSIDQPSQHQKLNVIQKRAFKFFGWRGMVDGVQVHRPA